MASSKLMAASASRNSDLQRELSSRPSLSRATDFLGSNSRCNTRDYLLPLDGFLREAYVPSRLDRDTPRSVVEADRCSGPPLNAEIALLDAAGAVSRIKTHREEESRTAARKTADEVWREILAGKKRGQQPKEEMMTLEDFLLKAEAEEERKREARLEAKEERLNGEIYSYKSTGAVEMGIGMGLDTAGLGRGRGKRSLSMLEALDKAAHQRQRRMIKNRESAARSRERKQAYQVELESMVARLEEENKELLKEKEERNKKRVKEIMENVIPVIEKQKEPRIMRKVRSMVW